MRTIITILLIIPFISYSQFVNKTISDGLIYNNTTCFKKDLNGDLWIGTQQGISKFSSGTYMGYNTSNGLVSDYVNDIEVDSYGKVWIGTANGISVYDGISWHNYQTGSSSTNNVKDVLIADNGDVWLATFDGVWVYNGFTFYNYSTSNGLPTNIIHGLSKDENGVIWIASNSGLCRFNNPSFTIYDYSSGMSANTVNAVLATSDTVYALCAGGLNIFDGTSFTVYDDVFPTSFSNYKNIVMDEDGAIWIGFNNGITKFNNNQVEYIFNDINTNLPSSNLEKIYCTDSVLYVASSQSGYYYTDDLESTITYNLSNVDTLDINNIHALVNSNGILFSREQSSNLFEVPSGSNNQSNYASTIWVGGMDEDNIFHLAGGKFYGLSDWITGPVSTDYNTVEYSVKYHRVWKINKSEIDNHIVNWNATSYNMPEVILNWPDIYNYYDYNSNNIYDPENGDYPLIRGDQAILAIYNDDLGNFTNNRLKMLVEIHALTYAYNSTDSALNNTIFTNYQIINKSNQNYSSVYLGVYDDIDIGSATDDFMGCDTTLNSYYIYNADNTDDEYGTNNIPAQSVTFLSSKMTSATYFTNNSGAATSDPLNPEDYYNYMLGYWNDGSPMTYGGSGYGGTQAVKYVFTGDPTVPTPWNEFDSGNPAGDRRGVGIVGAFDLGAGQQLCIDVAYVNAIAWNYTNLHSVKKLKARIGDIRSWYYNQNFICDSIESFPDSVFEVYARDTNYCDSFPYNVHLEIYRVGGHYPFTYQWENETGSFSSTSESPIVQVPSSTTDFYVTVTDVDGHFSIDTLTFTISATPVVDLGNDTLLCVGDTLQINLPQYQNYQWNTGINTDSILIFEQGIYSVTVSTNNCEASDDIFVTVDIPDIGFTEITPACINVASEISVNSNFVDIIWNTGETSSSINVNTSALGQTYYYVTVTDIYGCTTNDSTLLTVNLPFELDLGNDTTIDEDNYVIISPYVNPGTSFLWIDYSTTSYYSINGNYVGTGDFDIWLEITDINGCISRDSILVTIVPVSSVSENNNIFEIRIFPNPTNDFVNVILPDNPNYKYRIVDVNGKTVMSGIFNYNVNKINLNNLEKANYFLVIDELRLTKKIIVK